MTENDVIAHLKKRVKPYLSAKMSQPNYSNFLFNVSIGKAKPITIRDNFNKLGYFKADNGGWEFRG